jgi:Secretion system C-terminal sorting domain
VPITVKYKNWSKRIILKGYETHLCKYDLDDKTDEIDFSNFQVFPNPSTEVLQVKANLILDSQAELNIYDMSGKLLKTESLKINKGGFTKAINIKELRSTNIILVELKTANQRIAEKIIIP